MTIYFEDTLKIFSGKGAWHYVYVPKKYFADIKSSQAIKRGFGAVKVHVVIGSNKWKTSLFPDTKSGAYILFIKKNVRDSEHLQLGKRVEVAVTVVD